MQIEWIDLSTLHKVTGFRVNTTSEARSSNSIMMILTFAHAGVYTSNTRYPSHTIRLRLTMVEYNHAGQVT
jgi:hypothetical protein